jgi:hypothetical protein
MDATLSRRANESAWREGSSAMRAHNFRSSSVYPIYISNFGIPMSLSTEISVEVIQFRLLIRAILWAYTNLDVNILC